MARRNNNRGGGSRGRNNNRSRRGGSGGGNGGEQQPPVMVVEEPAVVVDPPPPPNPAEDGSDPNVVVSTVVVANDNNNNGGEGGGVPNLDDRHEMDFSSSVDDEDDDDDVNRRPPRGAGGGGSNDDDYTTSSTTHSFMSEIDSNEDNEMQEEDEDESQSTPPPLTTMTSTQPGLLTTGNNNNPNVLTSSDDDDEDNGDNGDEDTDGDDDEGDGGSDDGDDDDLPPLIHRELMDSSGSSSSDDDNDSDDDSDDSGAGGGKGGCRRHRGRSHAAAVSASEDDDDDDSEEEEEEVIPLGRLRRPGGGGNRRGGGGMVTSSEDEEDDSEDEDETAVVGEEEEERPVYKVGDYVVYQLVVQSNNKKKGRAVPPKQWTQGRIIKVKDKKKDTTSSSKRKKDKKNKNNKTNGGGSGGGGCGGGSGRSNIKIYHIQPLDGKPGNLVKLPNEGLNKIALDPIKGGVLNYCKGYQILFLVSTEFQQQKAKEEEEAAAAASKTGDGDGNDDDTKDNENDAKAAVVGAGEDAATTTDDDMADKDVDDEKQVVVATTTTTPDATTATKYQPIWEEGRIERIWPADIVPPMPYEVQLLKNRYKGCKVYTQLEIGMRRKEEIQKNETTEKATTDTNITEEEKKDSDDDQQQAAAAATEGYRNRETVVCYCGPADWKIGLIMAKDCFMNPEIRDNESNLINYRDPERWDSNYEAYLVMLRADPNENICRHFIASSHSPIELYSRHELKPFPGGGGAPMSPRNLLILGIKQDARLNFFRNLAKGYRSDRFVLDFCPDYWIDLAIKAGSYNALSWMEQDLKLNLDLYQFPEGYSRDNHHHHRGRGILHCLVDSPQALRFYGSWASKSHRYHCKEKESVEPLMDCLTSNKATTSYALTIRDKEGKTWLHRCVEKNDVRPINALLSPSSTMNNERLWELVALVDEDMTPLAFWKDDEGRTAADLARCSEHYRMATLLDNFAGFQVIHKVSALLLEGKATVESLERLYRAYSQVKDTSVAPSTACNRSLLLADVEDLHSTQPSRGVSLGQAFCIAAQRGNLSVLKWLLANTGESGDPKTYITAFRMQVATTKDLGEFTWKAKVAPAENALSDTEGDLKEENEASDCKALEEEKEGGSQGNEGESKNQEEAGEANKSEQAADNKEAAVEAEVEMEILDVVACAVHGLSATSRPLLGGEDKAVFESTMKNEYWDFVLGATGAVGEVAVSGTKEKTWTGDVKELVTFLRGKSSSLAQSMKRYRSSLIEDDPLLSQRLKILEFLVVELQFEMNVVDVLRWRQGGVLRWMVDVSLIQLEQTADKNPAITKFMTGAIDERPCPWRANLTAVKSALRSLTVGQILSLLSVEFDDLQSLDYLLKDRRIDAGFSFNGWNLLHVSAAFGRREIAAYMIQMNGSLVNEKCSPSRVEDGNYAVHIAMEAGDSLLASLFLKKGGGLASVDSKGRSLHWYGEKSKNPDIHKGLAREADKEAFEKDITSLCAKLYASKSDWEEVRDLMKDSHCCLDGKFLQYGYEGPDLPVGGKNCSFFDIVDRVAETANDDFIVWFHSHILPSSYYNVESHSPESCKMRRFWKNSKQYKNDFDSLLKGGKKNFSEFLDLVKKDVEPHVFAVLDKLTQKMIDLRKNGNEMCFVAPPIDPIFRRMESKVHKRRDTKVVQCLIEKKRGLLYQEFVTDLLLAAATITETSLKAGSVEDLKAGLEALKNAASLNKDHPLLDPRGAVFGGRCPFLPDGSISDHYDAKGEASLAQFATRHGHGCNAFGLSVARGNIAMLRFLMKRFPEQWKEQEATQLIRLAAEKSGNSSMVEFLIEVNGGRGFLFAVLGAADAGHTANVKHYFPSAREGGELVPDDPLCPPTLELCPLNAAVTGMYCDLGANTEGSADGRFEMIGWLGSQPEISRLNGMLAASKCTFNEGIPLTPFLAVFNQLYTSTDEVWEDGTSGKLSLILRDLLCQRKAKKDIDELLSLITKLAKTRGVDLQSIFVGWELREELPASVVERIETLQLDQLFEWSSHRKLVTGAPISDFKLHPGCDGRGLNMAQAAAFCDRVEIVDDMSRSMPATVGDSLKPTLDSIAKANESTQVLSWWQKRQAGARLSSLVASHYRRKKAVAYKEFVLEKIRKLQWVGKGHLIRRKYRRIIEARLDMKKHYQFYWGDLATDLSASEPVDASWDALKQNQFNIAKSEHMMEMEAYGDTFRQLDEAQQEMETYESDDEEKKEEDPSERLDDEIREQNQEEGKDMALQELKVQEESEEGPGFDRTLPPLDNIKITKAVLTWIRKSEGKYVDFFLRRIQQLASGQRSRILQKNLVGSCTTIYETYLEQHSAQRILWTPVYESKKHCILIWYVARHKEVSHLMALIDAAQKRSSKSFVSASTLYDEEWAKDTIVIDPEEILLDPIGDVPLKLHQVPRNELANLAQPNWVPPLRLTPEELKVVNKDGTVLLLGRSGTGKTLCIANRICLERDSHSGVPSFQQLFVARSRKICRHVRRLVGGRPEGDRDNMETEAGGGCKYLSFSVLLRKCSEAVLAHGGGSDGQFNKRNRVNFQRFRRELCQTSKHENELDPLVVWAQINNFIKGSIEAVQKNRPLTKDEYMALGERQCRLTAEQRGIAYGAFVFYQKEMERSGLWDDSDRCSWLLRELKNLPHDAFEELRYSRIYVDEIQDYSQVQLALFFTLCKNHKLFLAGDNAQSVEEGVDFRFEDLRAVAHSLFQDKRYIPDKPLKVNKNFRSHAGILKVAAAILERLFAAFPASTHKLDPDEGVFLGPRPGVLKDVDMKGLASLLKRNPRLMLLLHDDKVAGLKKALAGVADNAVCPSNAIIGIRDAKGLEFRDVAVVNFFSDLPDEHQKAWRELLRDRDISIIKPGFPQLEGQLKLMYTAITRCSRRLFFIETKKSIAGQAFYRWLTTTKTLAEYQEATKMEMAMTPDEWRSFGVDLAVTSEETDESPAKALEWLDRALHAFSQVGADGDEVLLKKAKAHRESLVLRVELDERFDEFHMNDEVEERIAAVAHQLHSQSLLPELYKLIDAVMPKLNAITQEGLEMDILAKLQDYEP